MLWPLQVFGFYGGSSPDGLNSFFRFGFFFARSAQVRRKPRSNLTGRKDTAPEDVEEVTFRGLDENGFENPPPGGVSS